MLSLYKNIIFPSKIFFLERCCNKLEKATQTQSNFIVHRMIKQAAWITHLYFCVFVTNTFFEKKLHYHISQYYCNRLTVMKQE